MSGKLASIAAAAWLAAAGPLAAASFTLLVVGDSLSEEYGFEISFSAPASNPTNANTNNWIETLRMARGPASPGDWFFFGDYEGFAHYLDLRDGGHEFNFGVPTFTTDDWIDVLDTTNPFTGNPLYYATRQSLIGLLPDASAAVILLGGNDLKGEYTKVYNDTAPATFYQGIVDRIVQIRNWLVGRRPGLKVVLCTVPDVGVTPDVRATYNDPVKRAGARARIAAMNQDLKSRAAALSNVAVADVHAITLRIEDEVPVRINGSQFVNAGAPENPPDHLFCRDGFHPATAAQSLIANLIVGAANGLLGSAVAPLADRELLARAGVNPDQPFLDWIAGAGVTATAPHDNPDGDAFDNLAEFAFGGRAGTFDPPLAPLRLDAGGPRLGLQWTLNPLADGYLEVRAERSTNLAGWLPAAVENLGGGTWRATLPRDAPSGFLRARVEPAP